MRQEFLKASRFAMVVVASLAPSSATAQGDGPECPGRSVAEATWCISVEYQRADSILNVVYRETLASIDEWGHPDDIKRQWREALREAQRAWIRFRDFDCGLIEFEWMGGSGRSGAEYTCMLQHTEFRTEQLRERY